ncbi:protein translocase subunit SecD [Fodinicola acaciae]|uniref:protein translocase subunit SecD n=1 Tax=Fodinicola acaciae TaxID=2681555 RepID=UPI001C9E7FFF|nr:protein translocase subunit SecD [Fodinicola acaciae]
MAPSGQLRVWRYFVALFVIVAALYGLMFIPGSGKPLPRLGLDLSGGATETLSATQAGKPPSAQDLEVARGIIEQRVNGLGVAEAEVVTEGDRNIVVSVAAGADSTQLQQIGEAAQLRFRQVTSSVGDVPDVAAKPSTSPTPKPSTSSSSKAGTPSPTPSPSTGSSKKPAAATGKAVIEPAVGDGKAQVNTVAKTAPTTPPSPSPSASAPSTGATGGGNPATGTVTLAQVIQKLDTLGAKPLADAKGTGKYYDWLKQQLTQVDFSDPQQSGQLAQSMKSAPILAPFSQLTPAEIAVLPADMQFKIPQITCAKLDKRPPGSVDAIGQVVTACGQGMKYLLAKAAVVGTDVSSADFDYSTGGSTGQTPGWRVVINFKTSGQNKWTQLTKDALQKQVAIVLDTDVVSAPTIQSVIPGQAEITGSFTRDEAQGLASKLKYGALPVTFQVETINSITATLGEEQLVAGLIAGGIGLALVLVWVLIYYRLLGLVAVASLAISGAMVYAVLVLLGRPFTLGFTLSLAGIAGFIVAMGITADSFVIFFEYLKDEVKDGRSARSAVPRAWIRARRTIISADMVTFLAAAVLYFLASGGVKGFAFTLGMSTILDLVVVFLFTHPLVALMARSRTFMSPRISGLGRVSTDRTTKTTGGARAASATKGA